jgi:hypothetical protein
VSRRAASSSRSRPRNPTAQNNVRAASVSRAALTEAACRWVGAIAPRAEGFSPAPRRIDLGTISLFWAQALRIREVRACSIRGFCGAVSTAASTGGKGRGARCAREPPAPSAWEARTCAPISDARAGPGAPHPGAPSPDAAAATREGAVDSGARGVCSLPPCLEVGRERVHERLVLWLAAAVACRRTTTKSNRCSGVARCTELPRSHGMEHATPCRRIRGASSRASCRKVPARGASSEDVRTQFVKEHPNLTSTVRLPAYPARVSSSLHGVLPASAARTSHGSGVFFRFRARASRF